MDLAWPFLQRVSTCSNTTFPINTLKLMRGAIAALQKDYAYSYLNSVFNAVWVERKNMGDPEVVAEVLRTAGLDADSILAASQHPDVKASLIANTESAVARGVFGAPTMFIGQQIFFWPGSLSICGNGLARLI